MPVKLTIVGLLAALAIAAVVALPANAQDDAQSICTSAISQYEAATASGDPAQVAARFTPDGTFNTPDGIFQGRSAIAAYLKPGAATKDIDTLKFARHVGSSIVCSGGFVVTLGPGAPMKELVGNYTKLLTKNENDWLIADLSVNIAPPPMAAHH